MGEPAAELSPTLVDGVMEYVRREGGRTAQAAVRERVSLPSELAADANRRVEVATFASLLRAVADVLAQPDAPERIGRALHDLLDRDVLATLVRGAQEVQSAYRELPHIFDAIDPTCVVEVEIASRRCVIVRFYTEHGALPPEMTAFHRGVVASVPGFLGQPLATVRDIPAGNGEAHGFEARWRRPRPRTEVALGLLLGLVLGGAFFVYSGYAENVSLVSPALRVLGLAGFAVLGLVFGLRARLAADLERQARVVAEQNATLRGQIATLRRRREELRRARRELEDEVRERTLELELKRERMSKLVDLSHDLSATLDLETILDIAMVRIPTMLSARLCSIYLLEGELGRLTLAAHNQQRLVKVETGALYPLGAALLRSVERETGAAVADDPDPAAPGWIMRRVIDEERSLLVHDFEAEVGRPSHPRYRTSSCMVILLRSGGTIIGILNVADSLGAPAFDEGRFRLAKIIGEHLGTAISNARLLRQTQLLSITDGLTGLYLHRHFQETLEREVQRARRYRRPLSLLLLDVDRFKSLNDRFGHPAGDEILRNVARVLRDELRASDMAARYGGDEFAAILPQTTAAGALALGERVRGAVAALSGPEPDIPGVSVSIGVCEFDAQMERADLVECTDRALYRAKAAGRDCVRAGRTEDLARARGL